MPNPETVERRPVELLAWRLSEYAEAARLSRSKLYQRIKAGTGPRVTYVDGIPLILRADGIAWLDGHRSGGEAA